MNGRTPESELWPRQKCRTPMGGWPATRWAAEVAEVGESRAARWVAGVVEANGAAPFRDGDGIDLGAPQATTTKVLVTGSTTPTTECLG
jgi:hypothetical protein